MRPVALFVIVSSRSINSLIWALMLVTIIGPGVLAGILAIGLRSIGFCAKLLYEAIEEIDENQVEAVRCDRRKWRANPQPTVLRRKYCRRLPAFRFFVGTSTSASLTVLGLVGAGGIGLPPQRRDHHARVDLRCRSFCWIIIATVVCQRMGFCQGGVMR